MLKLVFCIPTVPVTVERPLSGSSYHLAVIEEPSAPASAPNALNVAVFGVVVKPVADATKCTISVADAPLAIGTDSKSSRGPAAVSVVKVAPDPKLISPTSTGERGIPTGDE